MADHQLRDLPVCCIEYFHTKTCSKGDSCTYLHKASSEIELIHYRLGEEYFYGRVPVKKTCLFYNRGYCFHQQHCRFLHQINGEENVSRITHERNRSNRQSTFLRFNMPSSSSQIMNIANDNVNIANDHVNIANDHVNIANDNVIANTLTAEVNELSKPENAESAIAPCGPNIIDINQVPPKQNIETINHEAEMEEEGACFSPPLNSVDKNDSWNPLAPEFVPKNASKLRSYAEALGSEPIAEKNANKKLCPYANKDGICRNLTDCTYLHGELCDMCCRFILHPYNEEQRKRHRQECIKQHEKNMELSFAIARSKERSCGVCFEVVMEKASGEQRFGILPNCNHCFCLSCIRKWRQARQFDNKIIRACPECRVTSDFVCPSMYWVDTKEDKEKLIVEYKNALSRKDCKYFKKGQGKCPFGNKCFYLHAFPDGSICDVGPPPRSRRRNGRNGRNNISVLQQVMLWDFLDDRDFPWQSLADDLEDLVSFFTDSDESDWSDYELFLD